MAKARAEAKAKAPALVLRDEALTPRTFQAAVEGQSLFGSPPPLAVEQLTVFTGDQAAAISRTLGSLGKERTLVVWERGVPNAQGIVWRALKRAADAAKEFLPLSERSLFSWIQERLLESGQTIDPAAAQQLISACGGDLWKISSELDKLVLGKGSGPITSADVEALTLDHSEANAFAAVRAIAAGDGRAALRLLAENWRAGEEPRRLFFLTVRELRNLLRVRDGLDRGERLTAWSLASELRIPREAAAALLETAQRTTTSRVRALFERSVVAYYHLNTGRAEADEVLENLALAQVPSSSTRA